MLLTEPRTRHGMTASGHKYVMFYGLSDKTIDHDLLDLNQLAGELGYNPAKRIFLLRKEDSVMYGLIYYV
jgi:hypothetical protein